MYAKRRLHQLANHWHLGGSVYKLNHYRDRRQFSISISGREIGVAEFARSALFELDRLGAQHQMREIHIPGMWWYVRAFGHVAHIAQITLIDNLPVFVLWHAVHFQRRTLVDEIK